MLTVILSVVAAAWLGAGLVIQQHVAATAPWSDVLTPRLLLDLVRKPLWVLGIALMVVGQVMGAVALGRGSLALVEPLLAANLLFALPLAAIWQRRHLRGRDWAGAAILLAGLAGFLAAANPGTPPQVTVPPRSWLIAGGVIAAIVAVMVSVARRSDRTTEATLLGSSAGLLVGLQDALTNRVDHLLAHGLIAALTSWQPYVIITIAIVAMTLYQSAFKAAPLTASLPGLTVSEPLSAIVLGAVLFSDPLRLSAPAVAAEIAALIAVATGVYMLSHSPLIDRGKPAGEQEGEGPPGAEGPPTSVVA